MKNKSSICSSVLTLALTVLVSVSVQAQSLTPVSISGPVTAFKQADCAQSGSITIAGQTFKIAAGIYVPFTDSFQTFNSIGGITTGTTNSEAFQVIGTGRTVN